MTTGRQLDNYVLTNINRMARLTGTSLTERHLDILEFAYRYYHNHKVGPMFFALKKGIGATREEIEDLFPHGLNSVFTWSGIPIHTTDNTCRPPVSITVESPRQVYLDNNATTAVREEVATRLSAHFGGSLGYANPSSATTPGKEAYDIVQTARERIGAVLGVDGRSIIFTGSGSEANNLAIKGTVWESFRKTGKKGHIVSSSVEHSSVLHTVTSLASLGFSYTLLKPDREGLIHPDAVRGAIRKDTVLVAVMLVNNEIGSINPIGKISQVCAAAGVPFFADAIQGFCKIPIRPAEWGIGLLSMSGHKIYAPKGIGALYVDPSVELMPLIDGGGQEYGLRGGTENVPYIDALGLAATLAFREMESEKRRLGELQTYFLTRLSGIVPDFIMNGPVEGRIHNNVSIGFPDVDAGALVLSLDAIGICVSAGSACSSGRYAASHVLTAIGADIDRYGTIRFSFGKNTKKEDIDYLFRYLPEILAQLRSLT